MRVLDLISVIKQGLNFTFYPNTIPATAAPDCATVSLTGGAASNSQITRPAFQVLLRATHPGEGEAKAWEIYNFMHQKRDFDVGTTHVIFCTAAQSTPLYIGTDENGRHLYSINFRTLCEA
ncbi:hypothetical protein SAMN05660649_04367 [Desulfotomaculum arcticum]|uniref:Uncharacterized protein n=1 Tax=Desulfotruncus arcticus DSM 17038 TaxID=1121424 RepID=A0A1I2YBG1_9FIRM|nr:minor capsid protein [Desulfotruncus arcticus]SFH23013.1 hypothetical protein SAMN05660649_04367 [Desulfotomaculum arcticum] [Desulfotruncus arcticus DSM 17038]